MSSIGVRFIAYEFLKEFNSQIIDDYSVSFNPLQVKNKSGEIVYGGGVDDLVRDNFSVFEKIINIDRQLRNLMYDEHFRNGAFQDFYFDYGITDYLKIDLWEDAPDFLGGLLTNVNNNDYSKDVSYKKILNSYISRPNDIINYVISGQFSKAIIERFQKDLGEENVLVVNFLRNITSSTALHIEDDDYFLKRKSTKVEEFHYLRLFESILSSIVVMSVKNVINVKFEDFLNDGFIIIKDKKIKLPDFYQKFNKWITNWEKEKLIKTQKCNSEQINYYNDLLSDSNKAIDVFLDCMKFDPENEITDLYVEKIKNKEELNPICLHFYKGRFIMSDGLHRFLAYKKLGFQEVLVYDGTKTFNMSIEEIDKILDEDYEYEYEDKDKSKFLEVLPKNFFNALGYEPLTYSLLLRRPR